MQDLRDSLQNGGDFHLLYLCILHRSSRCHGSPLTRPFPPYPYRDSNDRDLRFCKIEQEGPKRPLQGHISLHLQQYAPKYQWARDEVQQHVAGVPFVGLQWKPWRPAHKKLLSTWKHALKPSLDCFSWNAVAQTSACVNVNLWMITKPYEKSSSVTRANIWTTTYHICTNDCVCQWQVQLLEILGLIRLFLDNWNALRKLWEGEEFMLAEKGMKNDVPELTLQKQEDHLHFLAPKHSRTNVPSALVWCRQPAKVTHSLVLRGLNNMALKGLASGRPGLFQDNCPLHFALHCKLYDLDVIVGVAWFAIATNEWMYSECIDSAFLNFLLGKSQSNMWSYLGRTTEEGKKTQRLWDTCD